jgi:hypothetical protein
MAEACEERDFIGHFGAIGRRPTDDVSEILNRTLGHRPRLRVAAYEFLRRMSHA